MSRSKNFSSVSLVQILVFAGVILAGYFIYSFGKVALFGYQLRSTRAKLQAEVATLHAEVARLEAQKAYVQTDEYVERAAREEFKMSRPGDQVIAPRLELPGSSQGTGKPTFREPALTKPNEPWRAWWALFMGP